MVNFTVDEHHTSEFNRTSILIWPKDIVALFSALNILLSITASLGNALILVALYKETSLHLPTKLLFRCLHGGDRSFCWPYYTIKLCCRPYLSYCSVENAIFHVLYMR